MALSSTPTLTEINTELGTTGQSLSTCIANAGKTGIWNSQLDFAGYSVGPSIEFIPSVRSVTSASGTTTSTLVSADSWSINTPLPLGVSSVTPSSGSATGGTNTTVAYTSNTTINTRTMNVGVTNNATGEQATFVINQTNGATITLNPYAVTVNALGGNIDITVESLNSWTIGAYSYTWITTSVM